MNKQACDGEPRKEGLDEATAAFYLATMGVNSVLWKGEELRTRDMVLRCTASVIRSLLLTMQYPRDVGLLEQLANLNFQITSHLDGIVLNADSDDPRLQVLRQLAKSSTSWPILARPSDEPFIRTKLTKLGVGIEADIGALPKKASLVTPRNRLTLSLVRWIENRAQAVLLINDNGTVRECSQQEARTHLQIMEPGIPKEKRTQFLNLLRLARNRPLSTQTLKHWCRFLTESILIIDPKLERFPELKQVKRAKGGKYVMDEVARLRSELQKFFHPALKNFLSKNGSPIS